MEIGKDHARLKRDRFEAEVVEGVLRLHKLTRFRRDLCNYADQTLGQSYRLTTVAFHHFYPSFPLYFMTDVVTKLGEDLKISRVFGNVTETKLFRRFYDRAEDLPRHFRAKPFALVFPWPRLTKPMCLHEGPQHSPGPKLCWEFRVENRTSTMIMESFLPLVRQLEWQPTDGDYCGG